MAKVGIGIAHYPAKPGAGHEGFFEHPESVKWSHRLKDVLEERGIDCFIAPVGGLTQKVAAINSANCDLALEIHFNACGGCGASGSETLHYPGSETGKHAAGAVQARLCEAMGNKDRGVKEGWYKMDRPGVVDFYGDEEGDEQPDYFLRATNCTALILEPEFIEHKAAIEGHREVGVKAIADAIEELLD